MIIVFPASGVAIFGCAAIVVVCVAVLFSFCSIGFEACFSSFGTNCFVFFSGVTRATAAALGSSAVVFLTTTLFACTLLALALFFLSLDISCLEFGSVNAILFGF